MANPDRGSPEQQPLECQTWTPRGSTLRHRKAQREGKGRGNIDENRYSEQGRGPTFIANESLGLVPSLNGLRARLDSLHGIR